MQFWWDCNVKAEQCNPEVRARRLDTVFDPDHIGFGFSYPEYIDEQTRLVNEVRGVRMFFRTSGVGKKVSISSSITKASMGASLFALAQILADLLMTKVFSLRKKYLARKMVLSMDFSEYMDQVNQAKAKDLPVDAQDEKERKVQEQEELWMKKLDEED